MKLAIIIIAVLATSLTLTHAELVDPIEDNINTLKKYEKSISEELERILHKIQEKIDELLNGPKRRVENHAANIKNRVQETENCIEKQDDDITFVLKNMDLNVHRCIEIASDKVEHIVAEIVNLVQEIHKDINGLRRALKKCKNHTSKVEEKNCYIKTLIESRKIVPQRVKAVVIVIKSVREAVPQILEGLVNCINHAEKGAQLKLDDIDGNIDVLCLKSEEA